MIAPDNTAIIYSPYTWDVTATRAKTINAGAYFRVRIDSPDSIVLNFDLTGISAPLPKITWEIDGWTRQTVDLAATVTIPLPTANTWAKHLLTVTVEATSETVNRWTLQANAVAFTGITTTGAAGIMPGNPTKVLVLGDSITEGVRTLNMNAATDVGRNSARNAWSYQVGEALGAEVGVVGFGSTGVVKASGSGGVPKLGSFWNTLWSAGPSRNVTADQPAYIIINMGTNDGASDITAEYTAVLNAMLAATTTTLIFCLAPFNGSHASQIQAAALAASNPARCFYVNTSGWWAAVDASDNLHPYGYTAPAIAQRLASTIQLADGGGGTADVVGYVNINGVAVPLSVRTA